MLNPQFVLSDSIVREVKIKNEVPLTAICTQIDVTNLNVLFRSFVAAEELADVGLVCVTLPCPTGARTAMNAW